MQPTRLIRRIGCRTKLRVCNICEDLVVEGALLCILPARLSSFFLHLLANTQEAQIKAREGVASLEWPIVPSTPHHKANRAVVNDKF
jgi:hypothetical protein